MKNNLLQYLLLSLYFQLTFFYMICIKNIRVKMAKNVPYSVMTHVQNILMASENNHKKILKE